MATEPHHSPLQKRDPIRLDNYRPITLANAIYKLWTTCIVILVTDYIKSRKILSPEQEGFRAERSCDRAITHLGLCVEDTHSHKKDIVLCYLDFKGAFPSSWSEYSNFWVSPLISLVWSRTYIVKRPQNSSPHTVTPHLWGLDGEPSKGTPYLPSYSS